MELIADLRLTEGPVLWFAWTAGAAGAAFLLWRPDRRGDRRWTQNAILALLAAVVVVAATHWLMIYAFSIFPAELPQDVVAWSVPATSAVLLWLVRMPRTAWRGRAAGFAAVLGVLLLTAVQINAYFGLNHTVSDLMGTAVARIQPLEAALTRQSGAPAAVPPTRWSPQGELPDEGELRRATIPGTASGFDAREAYIYFPPAYEAANRPALPVLVLFSGQPGGPSDWLTGGALRSHLDNFAARHKGMAPVTVVVDPNGSPSGNTLCMDSRIALADTYLSKDVPRWITDTLDVDTDHRNWAVGGFSFGASCAMQMGTRHPDIYSSVLAFSSEEEPALAKERRKTIDASFSGDTAAFERQTPLNVMKQGTFEGSAIYFGAGERDPEFIGYMETLARAARGAGFTVESKLIGNTGHSWDTPSRGMQGALDFLAGRWGLRP